VLSNDGGVYSNRGSYPLTSLLPPPLPLQEKKEDECFGKRKMIEREDPEVRMTNLSKFRNERRLHDRWL